MNKDIDLVYLWVDGNDPQWQARKRAFTGEGIDNSNDGNCIGRFQDNDELKYSLRSIEKNLSWIRNIYIVSDNQTPKWLNTDNLKIKVVNQNDILPSQAIPCYNSAVIETFLYKIPGLSETFLYANDDMFVGQPLGKEFFFNEKGYPIIMLSRRPFNMTFLRIKSLLNLHISIHQQSINNAARIIKRKFGKTFSGTTHHNIDSYTKSDCQKVVEEVFNYEIALSINNHLRHPSSVSRMIFSYYALATKRGVAKYVNRDDSCRIPVNKSNFMKYIERYSPKLFCLNDNQHATDQDRSRIEPFLKKLFPEKSRYEK